jgi:hypothetical protein
MKETKVNTVFNMNQISELNFQKIGDNLFRIKFVVLEDGVLKKYLIPEVVLDSSDFLMKEMFKTTEMKIGEVQAELNFDFYGVLHQSNALEDMKLYEESYFKQEE